MTEQEIIGYLKENKTRGVAFVFMPKEVKEWACDNSRFIIYYDKFGWNDYSSNIELYRPTDVIALPKDFELKEKLQGGWVEFKINKFGRFTDYNVDDDNHQISFSFGWHQWSEFLECSYEHGFGYTTFGGWQYENDHRWYLAPAIKLNTDNCYWNSYTSEKEEVKPAIPVKIRFWRETN